MCSLVSSLGANVLKFYRTMTKKELQSQQSLRQLSKFRSPPQSKAKFKPLALNAIDPQVATIEQLESQLRDLEHSEQRVHQQLAALEKEGDATRHMLTSARSHRSLLMTSRQNQVFALIYRYWGKDNEIEYCI